MNDVLPKEARTPALQLYLHHRVAEASGVLELARRCCDDNRHSYYEPVLRQFLDESQDDLEKMRTVLSSLSYPEHAPLKEGLSWLSGKLGRLLQEGPQSEYSALSRVLDLEGLLAGVSAKVQLWTTLRLLQDKSEALRGFDFERLILHAADQDRRIQKLHAQAVRDWASDSTFETERP